MKFILVLMLLLMIVDCKKLRNKSKTGCKSLGEVCGWFKGSCCGNNLVCDPIDHPFRLGISGECVYGE